MFLSYSLVFKPIKSGAIIGWLIISCIVSFSLQAQSIFEQGNPPISHYPSSVIGTNSLITDIDQADSGIIFMASEKDLLEFDGFEWRIHLGDVNDLQSIVVANDRLIYSCSFGDFGQWKLDASKRFQYTSLFPLRGEGNTLNEQFFKVLAHENHLYFISNKSIYVYANEQLTKLPAPTEWQNAVVVDQELIVYDKEDGLFKLSNLDLLQVGSFNSAKNIKLIDFYTYKNQLFAISQKQGVFQLNNGRFVPWKSPISSRLKKENVQTSVDLEDGSVAFGSLNSGLFIASKDGEILQQIERSNGLSADHISSMFLDQEGALWISHDRTISKVDLASSLRIFNLYDLPFSAVNDAEIDGDKLLLGTDQGLYSTPLQTPSFIPEKAFRFIVNTEGSVRAIEKAGNEMIVVHEDGLISLENERIKFIDQSPFFRSVQYLDPYLFALNRMGISIFKRDNQGWAFDKNVWVNDEYIDQIVITDPKSIWLLNSLDELIHLQLDDNFEVVDKKIYQLPEKKEAIQQIQLLNDTLKVFTKNLIYRFNPDTKRFSWEGLSVFSSSEISNQKALDGRYSFVGLPNGFGFFDKSIQNESDQREGFLSLRKFEWGDGLDWEPLDEQSAIPAGVKAIRIQSIIPNRTNIAYQYRLNDRAWSLPSHNGNFIIKDLSFGLNKVEIRARSKTQVLSTVAYSFNVQFPWYVQWYSFLVLAIVFILFYYGYSYRKKQQLMFENRINELQRIRSLEKQRIENQSLENASDKATLRMQIDELKSTIQSKTIELASKAKEFDQLNEKFATIKNQLDQVEANKPISGIQVKQLKQIVHQFDDREDQIFSIQLDELNQAFYKILKDQFPDLTTNDLRLCVYIKMGFNVKEVADAFSIKPSSVYISRSRLRKKLHIDAETDLYSFLNALVE